MNSARRNMCPARSAMPGLPTCPSGMNRSKVLRLELKKLENKRMDVDAFLEPVQRYTDATTITKRISAELILYIAFYPRRIH